MPVQCTKNQLHNLKIQNGTIGYVCTKSQLHNLKIQNGTIGYVVSFQFPPTATIIATMIGDCKCFHSNMVPEIVFIKLQKTEFPSVLGLDGVIPIRPTKPKPTFVLINFETRSFSLRISQIPLVPTYSVTQMPRGYS
jgi:hypothetical protein